MERQEINKTVIPLFSQLLQIQMETDSQPIESIHSNQQLMDPNEQDDKEKQKEGEITKLVDNLKEINGSVEENNDRSDDNQMEINQNIEPKKEDSQEGELIVETEYKEDQKEYYEEYYDENGGYYDQDGNYIEGNYEEGNYHEGEEYYDENGGYYDQDGNYIEGDYEGQRTADTEVSSAEIAKMKEDDSLPKPLSEETKGEDESISVMEMIRKGKKNRPIFGSTIIKPSESIPERPERPSTKPNNPATDLAPFSPKVGGPNMKSSSPLIPFSPSIPRMSVMDRSSKDLLSIDENELSNENLTKLLLSKNQIFELPEAIKRLTKLSMLDISSNRFTQFPQQILSLTSLHDLFLFGNRISNIPKEISSLINLRSLNISSNRMTQFPDSLATLTNLTSLNLSRNKLVTLENEIITSLCDSLATLSLQFNNIVDIPSGFSFLKNLKNLNLSHNEITSFGNNAEFMNVTDLDVSCNQMTEVPSCFSTLNSIQRLNLSKNRITMLPSIVAKWNLIRELRLKENQIKELPEELWELTSLQVLDLTSNSIKDLSTSLGNLIYLQELYFGDNKIELLPKQIGLLSSLKSLNLFGNELIEIPRDLLDCKELVTLLLGYNKLKMIPQSDGDDWTELEELVLSGNQFGRLPIGIDLLCGMKNLRILLLGNCGLCDPLDHLSSLKSLTQLDLSGNRITQVPDSFADLLELVRLDLSNNRIESLPKELFKQQFYLEELSLIGNPISINQSFDESEFLSLMDRGATIYLNSYPLSRSITGQLETHTISNTNFIEFDFSEMTGKRPSQEDTLLLDPDFHFDKNGETFKMDLWGVFDGHAGSAASKFSVSNFPKVLKESLQEGMLPLAALEKTFVSINNLFKEEMDNGRVSSLERHCGSTGDTRAILGKKGGKAVRLSFDHKPSDEEDRINQLGGHIVGESTRRINGVIAVSRAIGDFYMQPFVICEPYLAEYDLDGDENFIIVGCDGVWDEVEDEKAVKIVDTEVDIYKAVVKLRDYSYLMSSEDNISVVIIKI
eukprot:TRINITY_DN1212_c1_g1_i3.p1 TRINITY_DN1212_c1_g1~~TRINITY_DN1212_c1_g1_i3.p1  ORF type:complete len:1018 (+),score=220.97 TRINITY_DN1212_c1_g1_i3:268-3321(+)